MINPIDSLKARYQNYVIRNFEKTIYGKKIEKLHKLHDGKTCFVIGNGPSLTAKDLSLLHEYRISSFGVNRIYKIFDQTDWRPTYYMCTDPVMIRDTQAEVNRIESKYKFLPIDHKFYHGIQINDVDYVNLNYDRTLDGEDKFFLNCTRQLNARETVTIACMQLAVHMGYRTIYLLGIDHNFDTIIGENGEITIDPSVKNYFCDNYDQDVISEVKHDVGKTTRAYLDMRQFADKYGINIQNLSRKTKLTAFDRANFDDVIEKEKEKSIWTK